MAQLVIAAAGAAIGSTFGMPALGWAIGSMLGSAMFPAKGPTIAQPLMDLKVTGSEYGQPIPYVRGAAGIAGQMWWNTDRRATTTTTSSGGKGGGGGVESSTTTYDMDALIGLTDNEIVGVARIWNNGKLIYTADAGADSGSIEASVDTTIWTRLTIYTGSATQLPDPTYEAAVTTALAPAYRGRAYAFIEGLRLGQSGQVPNLTFEVVTDGSAGYAADTTKALLHFDGANGATSTTDVYGNTVTMTGSTLSTTQQKFGASSIKMLTNTDKCTVVGPTSLGASGWTLEAWFYWSSAPVSYNLLAALNATGLGWGVLLQTAQFGGDKIIVGLSSNGTSNDIDQNWGSTITLSTGVWHHIAIVRDNDAGKYYQYFDGTKIYEKASASQICPITKLYVGNDLTGTSSVRGYVDEFRFSNLCQYPGGTSFTPSSTAFTGTGNAVITLDPPAVSTVVSNLCLRAGLTAGQIDVTG
ncbi:MAG: LamG domain-containing protein, partial [Sulfuritalea sp.]|nr:LamG domain-containing protein [Sulfuritalea sp.]